MFKYTLDNKRYHTLNYFYKNKYGKKVFKIPLNVFKECPNNHQCIFCSDGSSYFTLNAEAPIEKQFEAYLNLVNNKWKEAYYIPYFQSNTNTYAPLEILKEKYEEALALKNAIGLSIGTRCDAIKDDVLDYLEDLNKKTDLTIELGLQSMHSKTLKLIKRGHDLKTFDDMVKKLKKRNISVVVHIINGLPNETKEDMLKTVKHLNSLNIDGIKIHMLHIVKDTPLYQLYLDKPFHILTKEEYIDIVISQLELLNPKIVIHRITGDPKTDSLFEPSWLIKKFSVLDDIDKEMVKRDTWQGKLL